MISLVPPSHPPHFRLSEELVRVSTEAAAGEAALVRAEGLAAELAALRALHLSAVELLGEREERLDELSADLADVRETYRQQIDYMAGQLVGLQQQQRGGGGGGSGEG